MMKTDKKALILLTSHTELGTTGRETGFYYDEMAAPYWALIDAGFDVDIVSVQGGESPSRSQNDSRTQSAASNVGPLYGRWRSDGETAHDLQSRRY